MPLIDCQKIANNILKTVKNGKLTVLYNRDDSSATSYTRQLYKTARKVDIDIEEEPFSSSWLPSSLNRIIHSYNESDTNGIIIVSPHPSQYECLKEIDPQKQVEGTDSHDDPTKVSCTARACVEIIKSVTDLNDKEVLVIGYGKAVGKPLAYLLMRMHVGAVTTTHQYTKMEDIFNSYIPKHDIVVSAVGSPNLITGQYSGKIFIDAGISIQDGQLKGDVHPDLIEHNNVTPVPGGVGPVTTALLLQNVSLAAQEQ